MRRHEHEQRRTDPATGSPREPEPLPAEATLLGLQRTAGNRAVSSLLARQPSPTAPAKERAATSTLGLGDEIGVIPLDSASLGQADRDGNVHDLNVTFVNNLALPKVQEAMLKGKPIPEGFYSSTSMKLTLTNIVITSMTFSDDPEGGQIVALGLNFSSSEFKPVR